MSPAHFRRLVGLLAGFLLISLGGLGAWLSRSPYDKPLVRRFCDAWFCPDEFSPERVFQLSQKAALGDPDGQLREFKRAVLLNSSSAYRWADLGDSEFNVRDGAKAKYAFDQALAAAPRSPIIGLRAANYYFASGDYVGTFTQLSKILADPELSSYYETVFFTYSRLGLPLDVILRLGVPANSTAGVPFLRFWMKLGRKDEAERTWTWLRGRGPVSGNTAGVYVAFLLAEHEDNLALQTWQDYTKKEMPGYYKTNWVFNGDFEQPFILSPFDWIVATANGVDVSRANTAAASGKWSLQLVFHADDNLDYRQTYQSVILPPGEWTFSSKVKTQDITTDQGPRFHLSDFDHPANLDVWTEPETGTTGWHSTTAKFKVRPGTGVIRIEVIRTPSQHLDNKIAGTAWLDEVSLQPGN